MPFDGSSTLGFSWRSRLREYAWPIGMLLGTRLVLVLAFRIALAVLPTRSSPGTWDAYPGNNWINGWLRGDTGWYVQIAERGYAESGSFSPDEQRNTAFFPGYPMLIRALTWLTRDGFASALIISNLAFVLALLLLYEMVRRAYGIPTARRTTALLLFHPFTFYFSAGYSESVFLLGAVAAFHCAQKDRWLLAGLSAGLAAATRVLGILVLAGLFIQHLEQVGFRWRRLNLRFLWVLVALIGPLLFMAYLGARYGHPLEFMAAQYALGWSGNLGVLPHGRIELLHLAIALLTLGLSFYTLLRGRKGQGAWAVLLTLASCAKWNSMGRLGVVVFPAWVSAARLLEERRWLYYAVLAVSTALLIPLAVKFALWQHVA